MTYNGIKYNASKTPSYGCSNLLWILNDKTWGGKEVNFTNKLPAGSRGFHEGLWFAADNVSSGPQGAGHTRHL